MLKKNFEICPTSLFKNILCSVCSVYVYVQIYTHIYVCLCMCVCVCLSTYVKVRGQPCRVNSILSLLCGWVLEIK